MFAIFLVPMALMWAADNSQFLSKVTDAPWEYVGHRERAQGPAPDGSWAVSASQDGKSYILFKQQPAAPQPPAKRDLASR